MNKDAIAAAIRLRPEMITTLEALAQHGRIAQHSDGVAPESDRLQPCHVFLASLRDFLRKPAVTAPT